MAEICQRVLDGFEMPVEWAINIWFISSRGRVTSKAAVATEL